MKNEKDDEDHRCNEAINWCQKKINLADDMLFNKKYFHKKITNASKIFGYPYWVRKKKNKHALIKYNMQPQTQTHTHIQT